MNKTLARLLVVSILLVPAPPALALSGGMVAFSAAGKILLLAIPVAAIGYAVYHVAGGDKKEEEKPEEKKEGKPADAKPEDARPAAQPAPAK